MRRTLGWLVWVVVLCMSPVAAGEGGPPRPDARWVEAQEAFDKAEQFEKAGEYFKALTPARHALELRESVEGSTHPDMADCLTLLGRLYRKQGKLAEAEPLLNQALDLREKTLGERHLDVAQSLSELSDLYLDQGRYDEARIRIERALDLREMALGERHPKVADSYNDLAVVYLAQAKYAQAEERLKRALDLRETALGENHPDVAHTLNDLAALYWNQGRYDEAVKLFTKSFALYEKALGKSHPDVAQLASNLATVYVALGQYGQAEDLFRRALDIYKAISGHDRTKEADSLNNLAAIYMAQGFFDRAEPLLKDVRDIRREALGEQHPRYADSLNNLAHLYILQEAYDRAEPLVNRAILVYEATLGPHHPITALALTNLAAIYLAQQRYDQARPLLERVLIVRKDTLGEQHPEFFSVLNILASLDMAQGAYDRAEHRLERALTLRERTLGESHPDTIGSLRTLARLRLAQQRLDEALPLFERALRLSEQRLHQEALSFTESRLSSFLRALRSDTETLYALLRAHPQDARVQRLALRASLLLKGRSVEETARISRTIYQNLNPEDRDTFERLRGLRTRRAALSLAGPGTRAPEEHQKQLKALTDEGDALEADLARRSAPLRAFTGLMSPEEDILARVAASLPQDGALVEFVAYADRPLTTLLINHAIPSTPGPMRYLALVLFADGSTRAVDLGPAEPINDAASRLRDALASRSTSFLAAAQRLHQLAFQPVEALLGATRRLLLSPDGQLGLVPFAALHDGHAFLLDSFDITYLTSGRELLSRSQGIHPASSVVVLADPQFSASPAQRLKSVLASRAGLPGGAPRPLPGTRLEAQDIQRLLPQSELFLGSEATKERLFLLPTPGILHIATHGFFLGDASSTPGARARNVHEDTGSRSLALQREPLLNSGLILASQRAPDPGAAPPAVESSLVTALELAGLNLWGTQLVVLSACDTGRGAVQLGQGVYGLRRALVVAGAETVVMSLWKVDDDSTRLLMEAYYRNLLAGQGRAFALSEAMRSMRATHPHPYYWAPFIALGSDAPLRAITAPGAAATAVSAGSGARAAAGRR